jgi:hypothetical protein
LEPVLASSAAVGRKHGTVFNFNLLKELYSQPERLASVLAVLVFQSEHFSRISQITPISRRPIAS